MTKELQLCRWLACQETAMPRGYLCPQHLVQVLQGPVTLPTLSKGLAIAVGTGLAAELILRALESSSRVAHFIQSLDVMLVAFRETQTLEQLQARIEALSPLEQDATLIHLRKVLAGTHHG